MRVYNVAIKVVDLIEANDQQEAIDKLNERLLESGFDPISGSAFESDVDLDGNEVVRT